MKGIRIVLSALAATALTGSVVFANPALLPSHPGYPAKGVSPVTNQPTANDPGQTNASGEKVILQSATSHDTASINNVSDPNRARILKSVGAGRLPEVEGALNHVKPNPAGVSSTVIR